jgi:hypothetical protein
VILSGINGSKWDLDHVEDDEISGRSRSHKTEENVGKKCGIWSI